MSEVSLSCLKPFANQGGNRLCALCLLLQLAASSVCAQSGRVDLSFNPGTGANDNVWAAASQADGKVVIGGKFTSFNGVARNRIARLNPDGTVDLGFNPGSGASSDVQVLQHDASGRVLIGGFFTSVNGTNRSRIARLNANGGLDTTFNPGAGADDDVWAIAVQGDGKVLVGGDFVNFNGSSQPHLTRLTSSGALDDTFFVGTGANGPVYAIAVQSDGRILIGGSFTSYSGHPRTNIARLNSNGTIDNTFNPGGGAESDVNSIALQSDGRIIIGGVFVGYNGALRKYVARLSTTGALDVTFGVGHEPNNTVESVVVLSDDRILIGGNFDHIGGAPRAYVARLDANGNLDTTFDPGDNDNTVVPVAPQSDGRVIIGGYFTQLDGLDRSRVARLHGRADGLSPVLTGVKLPGNYQVSFLTLTNLAYLFEYTDSLSPPQWKPLGIVFGDGGVKLLTDPAPHAKQRFYRLRVFFDEPYTFAPGKSGNTFFLSVAAFAWKSYALEYKNSLNDPVWTPLPSASGNNAVKVLSDTSANVPSRFYRVRAQ